MQSLKGKSVDPPGPPTPHQLGRIEKKLQEYEWGLIPSSGTIPFHWGGRIHGFRRIRLIQVAAHARVFGPQPQRCGRGARRNPYTHFEAFFSVAIKLVHPPPPGPPFGPLLGRAEPRPRGPGGQPAEQLEVHDVQLGQPNGRGRRSPPPS